MTPTPPDDYMQEPLPRGDAAHYETELARLYPGPSSLLLIRLCKPHEAHEHGGGPCTQPGKVPLSKGWNTGAIERYTGALFAQEDDTTSHITAAASWLAQGGNVGWVIPPGFLVLDCDSPDTTEWAAEQLGEKQAILGRADARYPAQQSQPGRMHFLVRLPSALELNLGNQASRYLECGKIDLRASGRGQIVCAPSTHATALQEYEWLVPLPEHLEDVPEIPGALLKALLDAPTKDPALEESPSVPRGTSAPNAGTPLLGHDTWTEGSRNEGLFRKGCAVRQRCEFIEELQATLHVLNEKLCQPPLSEAEVDAITQSAWQYERHPLDEPKERTPLVTDEVTSEPDPDAPESPQKSKTHYSGFWSEDAADQPIQEHIIKGVGFEGNVGMVYGPSGTLKTALVLDMAAALALPRREWFGHDTAEGGTLYVAAEGGGGLRGRILALRSYFPGIPDKTIRVVTQAVRLNESEAIEKLLDDLQNELLPAMQLPLLLVVFDTYSQSTPGVAENDSEAFTISEAHVRRVLAGTGAMQGRTPMGLLVHHPNKSGEGARGSSAMGDNLDFMMQTEEAGFHHGEPVFSFAMEKVKDDESGWAKPYKKHVIDVGTPMIPRTSIIALPCEWPEEEPEKAKTKAKRKKRVDVD